MLAIHHFDNAVEFILKCLATLYDVVTSSRMEYRFKDLWNEINQVIPNPLPLQQEMHALHDLRNGVQHAGNIPDTQSVIKYQSYSEDFFKRVVEAYFDVSYNQLTLASLITNNTLKNLISKAEDAFESQQYENCVINCAEALSSTVFECTDIFHKAGFLGGLWGLSDEFKKMIDAQHIEMRYATTPFYGFAKEVSKAFQQLGQAAMTMQFLDEYKVDFLKFWEIMDEIEQVSLSESELKMRAQFALEFVINLILRWQELGIIH